MRFGSVRLCDYLRQHDENKDAQAILPAILKIYDDADQSEIQCKIFKRLLVYVVHILYKGRKLGGGKDIARLRKIGGIMQNVVEHAGCLGILFLTPTIK